MSSLPEELYLDILLRVPVRSTFVCKCVCRSWCALISHPDFVKSHLDRTRNNNCRLLIQVKNKNTFDSITYDSFSFPESDLIELSTPYNYSRNKSAVLFGSCNGLVYGGNIHLKLYFLWNPATKEYMRLPQAEIVYSLALIAHGLGYDYKTDDYKLVDLLHKWKSTLVQVYSLRSNSWKTLESIQYSVGYSNGVFFNGALHWFGKTSSRSSVIVSMDMSDEGFKELQLPVLLPNQQYMNDEIGVLEEKLCVLADSDSKVSFDVWVMQDFGVSESWTKIYIVTYESIMLCSPWSVRFIGSFKNGEILFRNNCHIILYDPKYGSARKLEIDNLPDGNVVTYFETLVSLNSAAVGERRAREITRNLKKNNTNKRNRSVPKLRGG